jgi:signal transduction histidine kinase
MKERPGTAAIDKGANPDCPPEVAQDPDAGLDVVDLSVQLQPQEMSRLVAEFDWAATPLGPQANWPDSLKAAVRIVLTSGFPMWMAWGPDLTILYNDGYRRTTLGKKHPWALGRSAREVWSEIWDDIGPRIERVLETGQASWDEALILILERSGYPEETYHTFSYSPLSGPGGEIAGMLCVVIEDTVRVIAERQVSSLSTLAAALNVSITRQDVFASIESGLARQKDMPCTLTYLFAGEEDKLHLVARTGVGEDHAAATLTIDVNVETESWPIRQVLENRRSVTVDHLRELFPDLPHGCWDRPPERAQLVPIARQGQEKPVGIFIAALNPYRQVDASYAGFLDLTAGQIAAAITNAQAYEEARTRAEGLAELDRAKTTFFSNVSHELRTPLTLILGPVEDALTNDEPPSPQALEMLHRNALRLLKLVNGLLDFVRIEVGRLTATYAATDLSLLTAQLASVFRSAVERAGLKLVVECPPLPEPLYVDREMWEKILLNLLSNALKSTFDGEIRVAVRATKEGAEVSVSDTGTGIADVDLPHLFERFSRIDGAQRRSHEGSGIGLALVEELVEMHGGSIEVTSKLGEGTTFVIRLPFGHAHLSGGQIAQDGAGPVAVQGSAVAYVQEALGWLPGDDRLKGEITPGSGIDEPHAAESVSEKPVVLLVDDNADMREYVYGLLSGRFQVITAENGRLALEQAHATHPDLVLTDVMMPEMDGFAVLRELRQNPSTRMVPVIMLSARAGEEARIDGLDAGADDYLTKPFTARELIARVEAQLKMARLRKEALEQEAALTRELDRVKQFAWEALEHIPDLFATLDEDFHVTYWNAAAEETAARAGKPHLGVSLWDLYPEIQGTEVEANLRRVMTSHIPTEFEYYNPALEVWFQFRVYPMPAGGIIMYVRNTTDARKAEHVLRRSEQLAATGRLAASIAHEINNPLEAVTNLLFLAKLDSSVTGDTKNLLEMADKELQRLGHIAARSLKFYRQRTAPTQTQIDELLESVLFFHERDVKSHRVTLEKRYRTAPAVLCQPGEIQQVLTNLIGNALDALSSHGRMIVAVRPAHDGSGREGVAVTVADTGEGMVPATRNRLFHPFVTTKGEEGTGLGLWVSKGILEKHQGIISVRSKPGCGTVFRFFLPLDASLPEVN